MINKKTGRGEDALMEFETGLKENLHMRLVPNSETEVSYLRDVKFTQRDAARRLCVQREWVVGGGGLYGYFREEGLPVGLRTCLE